MLVRLTQRSEWLNSVKKQADFGLTSDGEQSDTSRANGGSLPPSARRNPLALNGFEVAVSGCKSPQELDPSSCTPGYPKPVAGRAHQRPIPGGFAAPGPLTKTCQLPLRYLMGKGFAVTHCVVIGFSSSPELLSHRPGSW